MHFLRLKEGQDNKMVHTTTRKQIARNNITYAFCFEKVYHIYLQMSVNSVRVRLNGTLHRLHLKRSETILYSSIMIRTIPVNTLEDNMSRPQHLPVIISTVINNT